MSRPLMLSNNRMLVGLNGFGLVHDLYYPYVGLENHTASPSARHKIGVWVDGRFSWIDDGSWSISMQYIPHSLIGHTKAENHELGIVLEFEDFVASDENVFIRNLQVVNSSEQEREIRVFFHQVLLISESTRGDTAIYIPEDNLILDYKGHRAFTVYVQDMDGQPFDQYSIGNFGIEGKEGTFKDAEDGELSGNNVEHGRVDTVLRVSHVIEPHGSYRYSYWLAAGMTNSDAIHLHRKIRKNGVEHYRQTTLGHWQKWIAPASKYTSHLADEEKTALLNSMLLIKSHTDLRGAVIASCDSQMLNYARDYYSYCWPRDAAYVLLPLIDFGYRDEPRAFFEFARDVISDDGYMLHKYLSDRSVGSSWHPAIQKHHSELPTQEDETAIVIVALHRYLDVSGDVDFVRNLYKTLVQPSARFLANFIDDETRLPHASYDLWEEKFLTTTYTTATVFAALRSAAAMAQQFEFADDAIAWELAAEDMQNEAVHRFYDEEKGRLIKGYHIDYDGRVTKDYTLDISSLYGAIEYGLLDLHSLEVQNTLKQVEELLLNQAPIGGMGRYEYDHYNSAHAAYKGNPWPVATLWLAQIYKYLDRDDDAAKLVEWTLARRTKSGILPEQLDPETGAYLSVAPLIWSHSELIRTIDLLNS